MPNLCRAASRNNHRAKYAQRGQDQHEAPGFRNGHRRDEAELPLGAIPRSALSRRVGEVQVVGRVRDASYYASYLERVCVGVVRVGVAVTCVRERQTRADEVRLRQVAEHDTFSECAAREVEHASSTINGGKAPAADAGRATGRVGVNRFPVGIHPDTDGVVLLRVVVRRVGTGGQLQVRGMSSGGGKSGGERGDAERGDASCRTVDARYHGDSSFCRSERLRYPHPSFYLPSGEW